MKDSLLTWLIFIMVMSLYCGNCGKGITPPPARVSVAPVLSTPAAESYPTVDRGTFLGFTTDNGQGALAIIYADDAGKLTQQYFHTCYAGHKCSTSTIIRDEVDIPAALIPGDRIAITRTADSAYAIAKEE